MPTTLQADVLIESGDVLGEGACYDHARAQLWWVDVPMPSRLHRLDLRSNRHDTFAMPQMVTAVRPWRGREAMLLVCHAGLASFDPTSGVFAVLHQVEPDKPFNRCNDAGTDARGRLWFGTMQNNLAPDTSPINLLGKQGSLYSCGDDLVCTAHEGDIGIANTVCWSPNHDTLYFSDTLTGVIFAYDFDLARGRISGKRPYASFERGVPDGSAVDAEGGLWNARWDGHCVVRFAPGGKVDAVIELPVAKPTSCCFGGAALDTLYITTACYGMSASELRQAPASGHLFVCKPGVKGLPITAFGGQDGSA